jgi:site-specific DNA recombinase
VVNAKEAARVREIFQLYLALGSMLPVVDELVRRDWKNKERTTSKGATKGGRPFDRGSLYALLTNPVYVGKVKHKTDLYPGEHEAIVTAVVFQQVQTTLRLNHRAGGPLIRNRYGALLRGIMFCRGCGRTMVHTFACRGVKRYRYYTCTAAIKEGRKACPSPSLPAAEVERVVVDEVRGLATDPGLRAEVVRQADRQFEADVAATRTEQGQLQRELSWLYAEMRKLAVERPAGAGTSARIADLHERIGQAERRLAELGTVIDERGRDRLDAQDVDAAFADFDALWGNLTPREQAQVMGSLVARVEFDPAASTVAVSFHPAAIKSLRKSKMGGAA